MIAVDTNILVYAVDANEPEKGSKAVELLRELEIQPTILLWQVVCEFGAALKRKEPKSDIEIDIPVVIEACMDIFPVALPSPAMVPTAWKLIDAHQMSYWDALLLAGCIHAGVQRLYTEDLQGKPSIQGVQIIDPFAPDA